MNLAYLKNNLSDAIFELNEEYASFYELPISLQNEVSNAYKKANSNVYLTSSFIIIFNLTEGFIEYLEEIYKKGYSPPSSSEIEICSTHIKTIWKKGTGNISPYSDYFIILQNAIFKDKGDSHVSSDTIFILTFVAQIGYNKQKRI